MNPSITKSQVHVADMPKLRFHTNAEKLMKECTFVRRPHPSTACRMASAMHPANQQTIYSLLSRPKVFCGCWRGDQNQEISVLVGIQFFKLRSLVKYEDIVRLGQNHNYFDQIHFNHCSCSRNAKKYYNKRKPEGAPEEKPGKGKKNKNNADEGEGEPTGPKEPKSKSKANKAK